MRNIHPKITLALITVICLSLSGCGFHLRNQNTLPVALQGIAVISKTPYDTFTKLLTGELTRLQNTSTANTSHAQLILHRHKLTERLPIIGSSQQARIYQYTFSLEYSLAIDDNLLIKRRKIFIRRFLTLNQNALLTTNNQQALLTAEIQQAAITQLINELKSRQ